MAEKGRKFLKNFFGSRGEEKEEPKTLLEEFGFEAEKYEAVRGEDKPEQLLETSYPSPTHRFRIMYESFQMSIEENYYWILGALKENGYLKIDKIYDLMTSGEQSSVWGQQQQRLSTQQSYASNYLATIAKLIRELIQIVHDLRILDERLKYFTLADQGDKNAWVTLKAHWIERVEGGGQNISSVYGLAQQVGFVTLPDLFFAINPQKPQEINKLVDPMQWNPKVKEVLKRKLLEFLLWKESNQKEIKARREYSVKFLRQHYNVIKMYINWIKPYLRNIKRLQDRESRATSADIVAAFENAVVDVEYLASKKLGKNYYSCILVTFECLTRPELLFHTDSYQQKGPIHVGRITITLRHYVWTEEQIEKYKQYRDKEGFDTVVNVDASLKEAMDALGSDVDAYLREMGEAIPEREEKKIEEEKKRAEKEMLSGAGEPFKAVLSGFWDIFTAFIPIEKKEKKGKPSDEELKAEKKSVEKEGSDAMAGLYKGYKKSHGFLHYA